MNNILNGKKILVADDAVLNQTIIRKVLEKEGVDCYIVNNGEEVLGEVKGNNFDLILLDVNMPVLDGIETARQLCMMGMHNIMFVTGDVHEEKNKRLAEMGLKDIIYKPYKLEDFVDAISKKIQSIA